MQVRELEFRLDGDGTGAEPDVPQGLITTKVQLCQREQADRGFRDHVGTSVEQFEVSFGDAEMTLPFVRAVENEAVRVAEGEGRGIIGNEDADGFGGAAEGLADVHDVVVVPVTEHTFGDGGRSVFPVGKHADLLLSLDERPVELVPRSPGEGNDVHIMVGEQDAVGQCL